jgi:CRISPR system Cascade subunit CasC
VDDLNNSEDDMDAAHMGDTEFAAGLFIFMFSLLIKNLSDNEALANLTIAALIDSMATLAPSGKQNSFASCARASYMLYEIGNQQPRSLSVAFLKPIFGDDILDASVRALQTTLNNMDSVYGDCSDKDKHRSLNASNAEGSLQDIIRCATEA